MDAEGKPRGNEHGGDVPQVKPCAVDQLAGLAWAHVHPGADLAVPGAVDGAEQQRFALARGQRRDLAQHVPEFLSRHGSRAGRFGDAHLEVRIRLQRGKPPMLVDGGVAGHHRHPAREIRRDVAGAEGAVRREQRDLDGVLGPSVLKHLSGDAYEACAVALHEQLERALVAGRDPLREGRVGAWDRRSGGGGANGTEHRGSARGVPPPSSARRDSFSSVAQRGGQSAPEVPGSAVYYGVRRDLNSANSGLFRAFEEGTEMGSQNPAGASGGLTGHEAAARRFRAVVVGGGNAGISVAARLAAALPGGSVAVIEPSDTHYYQPLWTLVGGGVVDKRETARPQASVIPPGVEWIRARADALDPDRNRVVLEGGESIGYDLLVVAAGIELHWAGIPGLEGAVGQGGVCSNYSYEHVDYTWQTIRSFRGGHALFTMPPPPIKCAGAPQKIAYLADDAFRRQGVRDRTTVTYAAGTPGIFAVPEYAKTLRAVIERRGIQTRFQHVLTELKPETNEAVFEDRGDGGAAVVLRYDMIHVTPPQRAPRIVRESPLADEAGWLAVDRHTLQSPTHPNVFALGDASSLPTSKTGAAIRKQAPVVATNALLQLAGADASRHDRYDGYTACPVVTGYGKLVMAEFDYDLNPAPTFPIDQSKERWSMYQLKRHLLPRYYWDRLLTGKA